LIFSEAGAMCPQVTPEQGGRELADRVFNRRRLARIAENSALEESFRPLPAHRTIAGAPLAWVNSYVSAATLRGSARFQGRNGIPIALLLVSVFLVHPTSALAFVGWEQVDPKPPARTSHALAYDSARSRTVLFGGYDGGRYLSDTWEWDGTQ